MRHLTYFVLLATNLCVGLFATTQPSSPIPGRVGNNTISVVRIGETDIYFYMTPDKQAAAKQLIKELNAKKLLLVADVYEEPILTTEISALASISPESRNGKYADSQGNNVMDTYAATVLSEIKKVMKIDINGSSREINLIVSQDAHKFHQDQFKKQYDYLNANHANLPKSKLIHDLTLMDWNMSVGTVSGTIVQDDGGDRLLFALFPHEVVAFFTTEFPIYPENNQPPVFPGPTTLPFHAVLSPVDLQGSLSPGSSKGQRLSTVVRGIVPDEDLRDLEAKAIPLPVNRPSLQLSSDGLKTYTYQNGILLKEFPSKEPINVNIAWNHKLNNKENVEILKTNAKDHQDVIATLQRMFNITPKTTSEVQVRHLIKRDGGFSKFNLMDLDIPESSTVVMVNSSQLPEGYKFYNIAEDLTDKAIPWIHMYQFKPNMAMQVEAETFSRLSLTPVEELIFRDENIDSTQTDGVKLLIKPMTRIDLFIFPKDKQIADPSNP